MIGIRPRQYFIFDVSYLFVCHSEIFFVNVHCFSPLRKQRK
jgi:hypothetical protein